MNIYHIFDNDGYVAEYRAKSYEGALKRASKDHNIPYDDLRAYFIMAVHKHYR